MTRVLVAGAGLAGTLLAGILVRSGVDVVLAERRRGGGEIGAGLTVHGNGHAALDRAGLGLGLRRIGRPIGRLDVHVLDGDRDRPARASVDIAGLWPPATPAVAVHRQELHAMLADRLDGCDVRQGTPVTGLEQADDGLVARVGDRTERVDLVVGADGIRSTVRDSLDPTVPRDLAQVYHRTVVDLPSGVDRDWAVWHRRGINAGLMRLRDGRYHAFVQTTADRTAHPGEGMGDLLLRCFADVPELAGAGGRIRNAHVTPIGRVSCEPARGRVVLVGDAAHGTSPVLSQGASLAFEDVVVLADELGTGDPVAVCTERYAARRRSRIAWLHRMTRLHSAAARHAWTSSSSELDAVYRQTYAGFAGAA